MDADLIQNVLTAIFGAGGIGAFIWGWLQKQRSVLSETKARVAEDNRDREMADSAHTLYAMMNERLKNVETEIKELRLYSRKLELHIAKLEALMKTNGIEPPVFIP